MWPAMLEEIPRLSNLSRLNQRLASSIRRSLADSGGSEGQAVEQARALVTMLGSERRFLEDPDDALAGLQHGSLLRWLAGE